MSTLEQQYSSKIKQNAALHGSKGVWVVVIFIFIDAILPCGLNHKP